MRPALTTLLLLLVPLAVRADDGAHALTPRQVEEGWLMLFDGETTLGWKIEGEGRVRDGYLELGGTKKTRASTTTSWGSFDAHCEVTVKGKGKPRVQIAEGAERPLPAGDGTQIIRINLDKQSDAVAPLVFEVPAGTRLTVRYADVKPTGLKSIFNGKDLTGWKKYEGDAKRAKSQFTVTREGWLNVKNGPGDLQTTGRWGDFVLQLECVSNGKNLNSGVFFRCVSERYQDGYEAQIQNGFGGRPKKYTVEEYDPRTHKLTRKKQVASAALDYGTGAIYRRMPVRRSVARDHEWFTMTVVAQGRHIATWVNGVPVVAWTDNRPLNDNPRQGCRLEKGHISLQGHDRTTNLSFRNIRIVELAAPKAGR